MTLRSLPRIALLFSISSLLPAADYTLKVTPQTIAWGYYWSAAKPVLTVRSGDTVEIQTVSGNPERLVQAGLPPDQIPPALRTIYKEIPQDQRGPGGHLLTGPVAIEGAEPGDVLEVRIREIRHGCSVRLQQLSQRLGFLAGRVRRLSRPKSFRWIARAMSQPSLRASRFRSGRSSAAWAWRRLRAPAR